MVFIAAKIYPTVIHFNVDIGIVLDRKSVCDRLNLHRRGIHFLSAHLNVFTGNNLSLEGDNGVDRERIEHFKHFGVLFLLYRDLKLACDILHNYEGHSSFIAEVFNEALNATYAGGNVFNISSFHNICPLLLIFIFECVYL